MTQQRLYDMSCRAARELLAGLQDGNLEAVERHLAAINHYVALAETAPYESLRGAALYRQEQLELLGGITGHLASLLGDIRQKIALELRGLGLDQKLLGHVTACQIPTPQSATAGYTSPVSPSA